MSKKKAKVLYVHHGGGNGGAPQSLLYLLQGLDRERYEPIVACGFDEPHARDFFDRNGFSPINLPIARFSHVASWWPMYSPRGVAKLIQWLCVKQPRSAKAFNDVLNIVNPDIVHLNSLTIAPLAPLAKRRGIPVVLHVREPVNKGHFGLRRYWLKRLTNKYADRVIYICQDNQTRLTGLSDNSVVIYNPVPFEKFDKNLRRFDLRNRYNIPIQENVLFFPGGSSLPSKGIFPFIQALAEIRRKYRDVSAIIPGLENDISKKSRDVILQRVEDMIRYYDLDDAVVRLPFTDSVELYYVVSDIVVIPFVVPHFARAVIEAGAMAKPVVGSIVGGITEVVDDGRTGLLATPGNSQELAEKILFLMEHKEKAMMMGEAGYAKAKSLFDAKNHAQSVMRLYDDILDRRSIK